ncbi:dynamin family protein [Aeromonas media]|uniref:dynamin family protein n=1 Tax=Aeromonas media TaxID=651 RepID=UPI003D04C402
MADHLCTQLSEQTVRERYALLSQACESTAGTGNQQLEQQLQALEQIIERDLPALARKGSPDNITDLLQALRLEMTRFREFCEYPALPSKVVVGLGGSFSAGKSSLINALIGDRKCLVTEVDPTTSLPTYLVQGKGEQTEVHAINLFNRVVSLSHEQFRTLTHDEKSRYGSQISSLLKSVVVAHPALPWGNLALLDTPGYSKADQAGSERTDANLARTQLNSAQFIVWLVPADKGTITEEDIAFLGTLDRAIPKLVVISRADKHPAEEIEQIVALVRDTLAKRGLSVLDVIPFSTRPRSNYSAEPLLDYFAQWNMARHELGFAQQFKRQFMVYQRYIDEERQDTLCLLGKFNRVLSLIDDIDTQADIGKVQTKLRSELERLEQLTDDLAKLQAHFFMELQQIGNRVGIILPEPDTLSLLDISMIHLDDCLQRLTEEWDVQTREYEHLVWGPLCRKLPVTSLSLLLRRDMMDVNLICEPLSNDLSSVSLPLLLRRDISNYYSLGFLS